MFADFDFADLGSGEEVLDEGKVDRVGLGELEGYREEGWSREREMNW